MNRIKFLIYFLIATSCTTFAIDENKLPLETPRRESEPYILNSDRFWEVFASKDAGTPEEAEQVYSTDELIENYLDIFSKQMNSSYNKLIGTWSVISDAEGIADYKYVYFFFEYNNNFTVSDESGCFMEIYQNDIGELIFFDWIGPWIVKIVIVDNKIYFYELSEDSWKMSKFHGEGKYPLEKESDELPEWLFMDN